MVGRSNASRIHDPFRCDPIHRRTREQARRRGTSVVEDRAWGATIIDGIEFTVGGNCWPVILFPGHGTKFWPARNAPPKRRRRAGDVELTFNCRRETGVKGGVGANNSKLIRHLIGAAREIRTPDPIITNDVLYQLSYCGPADQRRAGGAFRTAPLSMPVFPLLAIRQNAVARAASR